MADSFRVHRNAGIKYPQVKWQIPVFGILEVKPELRKYLISKFGTRWPEKATILSDNQVVIWNSPEHKKLIARGL